MQMNMGQRRLPIFLEVIIGLRKLLCKVTFFSSFLCAVISESSLKGEQMLNASSLKADTRKP